MVDSLQSLKGRRGRRKSTKLDEFHARAWFNAVAHEVDEYSPSKLERIFLKKRFGAEGATKTLTRAWDKYRAGKNLPFDGTRKNTEGIVGIVGKSYPKTVWIFRHPFWSAAACTRATLPELIKVVNRFDRAVARYYVDLSAAREDDPLDFGESKKSRYLWDSIGQSIWIERGDYEAALDHLAANLLMLRLETIQFNQHALMGIARNIVKSLGPLSESPWFEDFYEELFDHMEKTIWRRLLDDFCESKVKNRKGWRKTVDDWLINKI